MRITIHLRHERNLLNPAIRRPCKEGHLLTSYVIHIEEEAYGLRGVETVIEVALIIEVKASIVVEYVEGVFEGEELPIITVVEGEL